LSAAHGDGHAALRHFEAALASNSKAGAALFVAYTQHDYATLLHCKGPWHDAAREIAKKSFLAA